MNIKANYEPLSPLLFLQRTAATYGDKTAIIDNDIHLTYTEFLKKVSCMAMAFQKLGCVNGDRIAFMCRNNIEMLLAHYAVPWFGGILVTINTRLKEKAASYILKHAEVKILVVEQDLYSSDYLDYVDGIILNAVKVDKFHNRIRSFSDFMKLSNDLKEPSIPTNVEDETSAIAINYTSGTTGQPKGAVYSHRSTYLNALGECLHASLNNEVRYLWVLPMFHCNGWCFTWAITAIGGTHICLNRFDPDTTIDMMLKHSITHLCASPSTLIKLLSAEKFTNLRTYTGLTIITAGSAPPLNVIDQYEAYNIKITHVYGLTETHGPHSICEKQSERGIQSDSNVKNLRAWQGVAGIHSVFMMVVDENMKEVPRDGKTIGEVIMRGNNVMSGYYNDETATAQAFRGGWYHSEDLAVIHPNGFIEIKDRMKDIIISGGENISSIEVENVLYQHPAVSFAAVIAIPHDVWGEVPHSIIELNNGHKVTGQEIIEYCKKHLSGFKCPQHVSFRAIPKNSTGKVLKHTLRNEYNLTKEV